MDDSTLFPNRGEQQARVLPRQPPEASTAGATPTATERNSDVEAPEGEAVLPVAVAGGAVGAAGYAAGAAGGAGMAGMTGGGGTPGPAGAAGPVIGAAAIEQTAEHEPEQPA